MIGKKYKEQKKTYSEAGAMKGKSDDQNNQSSSTAEKIAEEENVSSPTVKRAEKFADNIDKIKENVDNASKAETTIDTRSYWSESVVLSSRQKTFYDKLISIIKFK